MIWAKNCYIDDLIIDVHRFFLPGISMPITAQIQGRTSVLNSFDPVVGSACRWCPYDASNCFKVLQDVLEEMGYSTDFYNELIMLGPS